MAKILLVEDDSDVREVIKRFFEIDEHEIEETETLHDMRKKLSERIYDVVLLDLMLPDGDASSEIPSIRSSYPDTGIIVISAKASDMDRILGIELGADDYITKPFNPREIVARVRAVLRRTKRGNNTMRFGDLEINPKNFMVKFKGKVINLSTTEFRILKLLASNPERVFSRNEILDIIWGEDEFISDRVVDVHISSIRNKLGKDCIKTIRGIGYKFSGAGDEA